MTVPTIKHATFDVERDYPLDSAEVFRAWATPSIKRRWFAADGEHELDFTVGGREITRVRHDGKLLTYESVYHDIVEGARIVYSSTLRADEILATVSTTTVILDAQGAECRLTLVEQGAFLDGHEEPSWRKTGTESWLDALGTVLQAGD
jgi:uncharacterized protein YndB with AHSA1/START domain